MSAPTTSISYRVSVLEPGSHTAEIELRLQGASALGSTLELAMAAWSPGSYLVRDYARFVRDLAATRNGAQLPVRKIGKHLWELELGAEATGAEGDLVVVRYRVYGRDLTVRTNHIDDTHAFLHGPATFIYVPALRHRPHRVELRGPKDWHVALVLPESDGIHTARDLDELLDSPIHIGVVDVRELDAGETPVELVVWGELDGHGVGTVDRLASDLGEIVRAHCERFGCAPFPAYTFLLMLAPGAYGGLEHRSSSANLTTPLAMATEKSYGELLELLSHELFHAWNGKRICPAGLTPLDYSAEQYTRCLWVVEGLTSYYDRLTIRRTGHMSVARYLEKLCDEWARLLWTPGRARHSLEDASFDAWIKLYKAHESNVNTTVSYYLKGGLVSLVMDLEIRSRSGGEHSLESVLHALWRDYGATGEPYPEDVQAVFETATGVDLSELFDNTIRGRQDPDLGGALAAAGLELRGVYDRGKDKVSSAPKATADRDPLPAPAWLGLQLRSGARVGLVLDGSPAAQAGVSPGDELVAIDRRRVRTEGDVQKRLRARSSGDLLDLTLFRDGRQRQVQVALCPSPHNRFEIWAQSEPSAAERSFYEAWLGAEHPASGAAIAGATVGRFV